MEDDSLADSYGSGRCVRSNVSSPRTSHSLSLSDSPTSQALLHFESYLDWNDGKKPLLEEVLPPVIKSRRRRNFILMTLVVVLGTTAVIQVIKSMQSTTARRKAVEDVGARRVPYFTEKYLNKEAGPGTFPLDLHNVLPSDMCSICDCHASPSFYSPAKHFTEDLPPRPLRKHVYPSQDSIDTNEFMRQTILDIYCARQHLSPNQALKLLRRTRNLEEIMSWSLTGLEFGKPTIYLTTATSPNGRTGALRPQYFRRSGRAIRSWLAQQEKEAKDRHPGWQVMWIAVEDDVDIDPLVVRTLRRTGIPYVYFAYGKTQAWGNAQKNAVLQMVYAMSRPDEYGGLLGHGPVYGLDDDNKILPELLSLLVRLNRVGVLSVGNLGPSLWERPVLNEIGEVVSSESLWQDDRKFPFDYGSYSFNSSMLGTVISGPMFWKHHEFAGETQFLDQMVGNIRDIEPLCDRDNQECYVVWHNEELLELEKMTDDEEIAYVKKFGAVHLFEQLGLQAIEFEKGKVTLVEKERLEEERKKRKKAEARRRRKKLGLLLGDEEEGEGDNEGDGDGGGDGDGDGQDDGDGGGDGDGDGHGDENPERGDGDQAEEEQGQGDEG